MEQHINFEKETKTDPQEQQAAEGAYLFLSDRMGPDRPVSFLLDDPDLGEKLRLLQRRTCPRLFHPVPYPSEL